ncbi:MAG: tRNA (guanosine(46)-N7)-methyltransferase TrmB [Cyclobacteriaceae bacterium]|nr:tRNA (guanosine(46)-N7)-methyltransferase TrmB [Cyclobacteriaceae bacterium]
MKSKLARFKVIAERENVLQPGKELYFNIKGNWNKTYFKNDNPITIELACGRGEYSVGMAALFPDRNFVGIDIKGDRIWKGSTQAVEQELENVAFLRAQIHTIENFFTENEVSEIWLTFPDPRPKKRDIKRRLCNNWYFDLYKKILEPEGIFRLKTDNTDLFNFTVEELQQRSDIADLKVTFDVYQSEFKEEVLDIKTRYEEMFASKGETIKYLRFRFAG